MCQRVPKTPTRAAGSHRTPQAAGTTRSSKQCSRPNTAPFSGTNQIPGLFIFSCVETGNLQCVEILALSQRWGQGRDGDWFFVQHTTPQAASQELDGISMGRAVFQKKTTHALNPKSPTHLSPSNSHFHSLTWHQKPLPGKSGRELKWAGETGHSSLQGLAG